MSRQYEKQLPVKLDSEQIAERGQEMAGKALDAARIELDIDKVKDEARGKLKRAERGPCRDTRTAEKAGFRGSQGRGRPERTRGGPVRLEQLRAWRS